MKLLAALVGGLSAPSKMPCYSWSTPAWLCGMGSRLAKIAGSVCSKCYAMKGYYVFKAARDAMMRRWNILQHALTDVDANIKFVDNFVNVLEYLRTRTRGATYDVFRWFDSGDLQNERHLTTIAEIATRTPQVRHWLPTKEYGIVRRWMNTHTVPDNLCIRVSAAMIDGKLPELGLPVSTVSSEHAQLDGFKCPAVEFQNGECRECRACWDADIPVIIYPLH